MIKAKGLDFTNEAEKKVREGIRRDYGMDAYIQLNKKKINKALETNPIVIINGMRSWEEYVSAQKLFPKSIFTVDNCG